MIRNKTVFILGAGASYPYGYPLGTELFSEIISLRKDKVFLSLLTKAFEGGGTVAANIEYDEEYRGMTELLERSGLMSIDAFMVANPKLAYLSKFAVTYLLLNREEKNPNITRVNESGDWYRYLYNEFLDGSNAETIGAVIRNEISFVTFNYDVSLERFFFNALESKFSRNDSFEFFKQIPIKHVYGKVRMLPWETGGTADDFLFHLTAHKIKEYSAGINYVHENADDSNLNIIRTLVKEAQRIVFLGFAFDVRNVERLRIDWNRDKCEFFASTYGMTEDEFKKKVDELHIKVLLSGGSEKDSLGLLRGVASRMK